MLSLPEVMWHLWKCFRFWKDRKQGLEINETKTEFMKLKASQGRRFLQELEMGQYRF